MSLPQVYISSGVNRGIELQKMYPGRIAVLFNVRDFYSPKGLPFALDNGRYGVWKKGLEWKENDYEKLLDWAVRTGTPEWGVVPDVVANAEETFREYKKWSKRLERLFPLAIAVQDGMIPSDILQLKPLPELIFIGGSTTWKWKTLRHWTKVFPRVHVGRVNSYKGLWNAQYAGAESTDSTCWLVGGKERRKELELYLSRSQQNKNPFKLPSLFDLTL